MKSLRAIFSIVFLMIFIGTTSGIQLYAHYCGELLAEISILETTHCEDDMDSCEAEEVMECCIEDEMHCDDEAYFIQLDIDLQNPEVVQFSLDLTALSFKYITEITPEELVVDALPVNYTEPLLNYKVPIYRALNKSTLYG